MVVYLEQLDESLTPWLSAECSSRLEMSSPWFSIHRPWLTLPGTSYPRTGVALFPSLSLCLSIFQWAFCFLETLKNHPRLKSGVKILNSPSLSSLHPLPKLIYKPPLRAYIYTYISPCQWHFRGAALHNGLRSEVQKKVGIQNGYCCIGLYFGL